MRGHVAPWVEDEDAVHKMMSKKKYEYDSLTTQQPGAHDDQTGVDEVVCH